MGQLGTKAKASDQSTLLLAFASASVRCERAEVRVPQLERNGKLADGRTHSQSRRSGHEASQVKSRGTGTRTRRSAAVDLERYYHHLDMALSRLAALRAGAPPIAARQAFRSLGVQAPRHASTQPPPTPTNVGATPPVTPPVAPPVTTSLSPSSSSSSKKSKGSGNVGSLVSLTLFLFGSTFLVTYYLDSRSAIHRWVAMPFLHTFLDPESAQKLAIDLLQSGIAPRDYTGDDEALESDVSAMRGWIAGYMRVLWLLTGPSVPSHSYLECPLRTPLGWQQASTSRQRPSMGSLIWASGSSR